MSMDRSVDTPASIAIIGAGPIGLEAGLYARYLGYHVNIYEQGRICENLRRWGHVELFTPSGTNRSPLGLAALQAQDASFVAEPSDAYEIGQHLVERYFSPLAASDLLDGCVHERTAVVRVCRDSKFKEELGDDHDYAEHPFRLSLRRPDDSDEIVTAEVVIDASGTFGNHHWMGRGGVPAGGEEALMAAGNAVRYDLPDPVGVDRSDFVGRHTLVVGSGHSAATTVVALCHLQAEDPATRVTWITRLWDGTQSNDPIPQIVDDPLPRRKALVWAANQLAARGQLTLLPGAVIEAAHYDAGNRVVRLQLSGTERNELIADRVVANVGWWPDWTMCTELSVHPRCGADAPTHVASSEQPASTDCAPQVATGPAALLNPEPHFYVLGAKRCGRPESWVFYLDRSSANPRFVHVDRRPR